MRTKITLLLTLASVCLFAQPWLNSISNERRNTLSMKQHVAAFESYWQDKNVENGYYYEKGVKQKAYGWKQFKRWSNHWEDRVNPLTGDFPSGRQYETAFAQFEQSQNQNRSLSGQWISLGPNSSIGGYSGVGRVNCVAFHPTDANTFWAATPAGGLWATTDGGANWSVLTDQNNVLGVSFVAIPSDYASSQTIYIATGDRDAGDNNSMGVLKSTNGGSTWNTTGLSFTLSSGTQISKLLIDPNNNNILYASTFSGVYRTSNAGVSWSSISSSTNIVDLEFKMDDSNILLASTKYGKIYRINVSGNTESIVYNESSAYRIELAVTEDNPNLVYAVVGNSGSGLHSIIKSINGGLSFSTAYNGPNLLGWDAYGGDSGGQAWYDLALTVSPLDENVIYCGGVNTWKSEDGGSSWNVSNHWWGNGVEAVHADKHYLAFNGGTLYECNDGGMYCTTDGEDWTDVSNGIINSQMYKIGVSQTESNSTIAGLQDNGTKLLRADGTWADVKGGDGMECLIDYTNNDIQYGTYVYGQISRTMNGWNSSSNIEPTAAGMGSWVTPYIIHPTNPEILYAGYGEVWKSIDRGTNWTQISSLNINNKVRSMAVSSSSPSTLFVTDKYSLWKTTNGGTNWSEVSSNLPSTSITSITIKADDPNTVWVTMGSYNSNVVYQTSNGGSSWTNISVGIPNIPASTIVQNTQNTSELELYVGTDFGVYIKQGAGNWQLFNSGLPKVVVSELDIYYDANPSNSKLRAATYGRGLWESDLFSSNSSEPTVNFSASSTQLCPNTSVSFTDLSSNGPTSWVWTVIPSTGFTYVNSTTANSQNPEIEFSQTGTYSIQLSASNADGSGMLLKSNYITVSDLPIQPSLISGNVSVCQGNALVYAVSEIPGVNYNWTLPSGWSGSSATNSIVVTPGANAGTISVSSENSCGVSPVRNLSVSVSALPTAPSFTQSTSSVCESSTVTYVVSATSGYTYNWAFPSGWTGSGTSHIIELTPNSSSGVISVNAENACGNGPSISTLVNVNSIPELPVFENPTLEACGTSVIEYAVNNETGAVYHWTLPSGWTGTSSTNEISVSLDGTGGSIEVYAENSCGIGATASIQVEINSSSPGVPSIIAGQNTACQNLEIVYSVEAVGGLSYNWILPSGWTGTSTSNAITVIPNSSSGTLSVSAENLCGVSDVQSKIVTIGSAPSVPSFTQSSNSICEGSTNSFSVASVTGNTYNWTLPVGWTGSSTSNEIEITPGSNSGIISVNAQNGCGTGPSISKVVNVNSLPELPVFDNPILDACGSSAIEYTVNNETGSVYHWTIPSGWTGTSTSNEISVSLNGTGGNLEVYAENSCGIGATASIQVEINSLNPEIPSVITGQNTACHNIEIVYSVEAVDGLSYNWMLPSGWTGSSLTNSITVIPSSSSGMVSVSAENSCGESAVQSKIITISSAPSTPSFTQSPNSICEASLNSYSVTEVSGNTYNWTLPTGWSGNSTSNEIEITPGSSSGMISVNAQNACGTGPTLSTYVNVNNIPELPMFNAPVLEACGASVIEYAVNNEVGSEYHWTLPSGWSGASTTNEISVSLNNTAGSIQVYAENNCGIGETETIQIDIITANPVLPSTIAGQNIACESAELIYTVDATEGLSYNWVLPSGWTGSSVSNSIAVVPSAIGGTVSVSTENSCGTSPVQSKSVVITALPSAPSFTQSANSICEATIVTYSVAASSGNTYNWNLPSGWTGSSTSNTIDVSPDSNSGMITVNSENSCGTSPVLSTSVNVTSIPVLPEFVDPVLEACASTVVEYAVTNESGSNYYWTLPEGWIGTSSTNVISVTLDEISGNISVYGENECGISASEVIQVEIINSSPEQPSVILGEETVCENGLVQYSVESEEGISYNWTLPEGWTGSSDLATIEVNVGDLGGTILVEPSNDCGLGLSRSFDVDVRLLPVADFSYDIDQNTYSFNNLSENADAYLWSFGDNTESVESNPVHIYPFDGDYNISLVVSNACAEDSYSTQVNITTIGGIENQSQALMLFPNPTNGQFTISGLKALPFDVKVIDLTGRVLIQKSFDGVSTRPIDLSRYSDGAYHVMVIQGEQQLKQKLILHK